MKENKKNGHQGPKPPKIHKGKNCLYNEPLGIPWCQGVLGAKK